MTTMTLHITNSGIIDKIQRFVAELSGVEITEIKETNGVCEDETAYLSSSPAMLDVLSQGDQEIEEGGGTKVSLDTLWK